MTMNRYLFAAVALAVLGGCASSRTVHGPAGKSAHAIRCGNAFIEACYEKAAQLCPHGYDIVDRPMPAVGMPTQMLVACKAP